MTRQSLQFVWMSALALLLSGALFAAPRVTGAGLLTAKGDGEVHVQLIQGRVIIKGEGRLEVPRAARVNFSRRQEEPRTRRVCRDGEQYEVETYRRFSGMATITGDMSHIAFRGKAEILISGAAGALLIGDGAYNLNNRGNKDDEKGKWSRRGECKTCENDHEVNRGCDRCKREYDRRGRDENDRNRFQRDMLQVGNWELPRDKDGKWNDNRHGKDKKDGCKCDECKEDHKKNGRDDHRGDGRRN